LNDDLPETYEARLGAQLRLIERREPPARTVYPDVAILEGGPAGRSIAQTETRAGLLLVEPITIELPVEEIEEVQDLWIEIRHRPERDVVTAIEILSPTNKLGEGYWQYQAKRRALLHQNIHLVELDLLIRGQRLPMRQDLPAGDFYAIVSRANRRSKSEVYAWSVRHSLPNIPIPLRSPDPDVPLELPAIFALAYDRGRYARALDYSAPLDLPLADADRAWVEGRAHGARS
jgi:hypothetical protein